MLLSLHTLEKPQFILTEKVVSLSFPGTCQSSYLGKSLSLVAFDNIYFCCYSVAQLCLTLCDPLDCSRPGFPVLHYRLESAHTHVCWVGDAIQPSHPLSPPSPALNLSQHQGLFQWVSSSHQVAKVLEPQL